MYNIILYQPRNLLVILIITMSFCAGDSFAFTKEQLVIKDLRCNYLFNPLGIDGNEIKLSWIVASVAYNQQQAAYQILVASSAAHLNSDRGDLWDTGKVSSHQSTQVTYKGKSVASRQRVFWKVRIWNNYGKSSAWSTTAWWEMGLLKNTDWRAKWIGTETTAAENPDLYQSSWIWLKDLSRDTVSKESVVQFQKHFDVPKGRKIRKAIALFDALGVYHVSINNTRVDAGSVDSAKKYIDVTTSLTAGENIIEASVEAKNLKGFIGGLVIYFDKESSLEVFTDTSWLAKNPNSTWTAAKQINLFDKKPLQWAPRLPQEVEPAPMFRKSFFLDKKIKSARAYISGLGYYELYLNDRKVGDHVLDPGYTRYDKRVLYVSYDVTAEIHPGANAVGILLGNGFYNQHARDVWYFHQAPWRADPRAIIQINIEYHDGSQQVITSDETWKTSTGPIVFDGIRNGETYDARLAIPTWASANYNDQLWKFVSVVSPPRGVLSAQQMPPIKVIETLSPKSRNAISDNIAVFDIGQNIAGWARIQVRGKKGAVLTLKYGEKLDKNGRVDQSNINWFLYQGDLQVDRYIMKGDGEETWEPRFVYHGFQYVEVSGLAEIELVNLEGRVVHTNFESNGSFTCSNDLLNKIQKNTLWSYRGNYHSIPTDCPQREKNGWLADAHLAMETALLNFENSAAYIKWLQDLRDEQAPSGQLPGIVPTAGWGYDNSGGPAWESAFVLIPWYMYLYKGDTAVLRDNYQGWKQHMKYMQEQAQENILNFGLGDWLAVTRTPNDITSTASYYQDALIISKVAGILGHHADQQYYQDLARKIKRSFQDQFLDKQSGTIASGTQTAQCIALHYDLVDSAYHDSIFKALVSDIEKKGNHVSVGALGHKLILRVLADRGRVDLAYALATQTTYPGWGHWIAQGATTLWEDWKGEGSLNHIFLGDISAWFYQYLAGIRLDEQKVGFKHFRVEPEFPGDLNRVQAEVNSPYGIIKSEWIKDRTRKTLNIHVPFNTSATIVLPASKNISINSKPLKRKKELVSAGTGKIAIEVSSGDYELSF